MSYRFASTDTSIDYAHRSAFDAATKFTLSMWVKYSVDGRLNGYWGPMQYASFNGWTLNQDSNDATNLKWVTNAGDGGDMEGKTGAGNIGTAWTHLYLVYDGTLSAGSRLAGWKNGSAITFATNSADPNLGTNTASFQIKAGSNNGYKAIAEVAMWAGEAITDSGVISALAAGGNPLSVRPTGLDVYIPLKTDAIDTVASEAGTVGSGITQNADHPTVDDPPGSGPGDGAAIIMVL